MHTHGQVRQEFQNEYNVLCQLPPHENVIHMWAFFYDRANPNISPHFKRAGKNARTMCLFLLMDELPMNMKEHVDLLVGNQGPKVSQKIMACVVIFAVEPPIVDPRRKEKCIIILGLSKRNTASGPKILPTSLCIENLREEDDFSKSDKTADFIIQSVPCLEALLFY